MFFELGRSPDVVKKLRELVEQLLLLRIMDVVVIIAQLPVVSADFKYIKQFGRSLNNNNNNNNINNSSKIKNIIYSSRNRNNKNLQQTIIIVYG